MITDKLKHELTEMLSLKRKPIIEGWTTQEKAEVLAGLVIDQKPLNIVEIGVFGGRSLFSQAMALRENGMGVITGIDPWCVDAAIEGDNGEDNNRWWTSNINFEDIYVGFIKAVLDLQLTKWCKWIRERGEIACKLFPNKSLDMVFLDANHSEYCSCRDVQLWIPKVKPGGFFSIDDCDWQTQSKALKIIDNLGMKEVMKTTQFTIFRKPE